MSCIDVHAAKETSTILNALKNKNVCTEVNAQSSSLLGSLGD